MGKSRAKKPCPGYSQVATRLRKGVPSEAMLAGTTPTVWPPMGRSAPTHKGGCHRLRAPARWRLQAKWSCKVAPCANAWPPAGKGDRQSCVVLVGPTMP
ncbi:hypothetical protein BHM03_00046589 [Ensete ventricosum]|nr:hypothetical protein BHM03_00046589 [Ensete ventricosum]